MPRTDPDASGRYTRMVEHRQKRICPNCGRGQGLGRSVLFPTEGISVRTCRYCGFEKVTIFRKDVPHE